MTFVTLLSDSDVNDVIALPKIAAGKNSSNNTKVTTSMYYDSQGVIYKVADGNASVFAYAPGIVGKSQKLSIITIPLFITYDNTSTLRVMSIETNAFTGASRYFGLKSVIVPEGIKISDNSGIPVKQRITPNTSETSLTRLTKNDIRDLRKADVKTIAKKAANVAASDKGTIDKVTFHLSSRHIPTAGRAVLDEFQAGKGKSAPKKVPTVRVNPKAFEMATAKSVKQDPYGFYSHSNLGWLMGTDVDGATEGGLTGYGATLAGIASDTRAMYADGIAAANKPVPAGLTDTQASAWNQSQTEMAISAKVVFDETTLCLENSDTSDSVVTALNNMKVALASARTALVTAGLSDTSDLIAALDKPIAAVAGLVEKIVTAPLSALTPAQVGALTPEQIKALPPAAFAGLKSDQVAALPPSAFAGLKPEQVAALPAAAMGGMSPSQMAALTTGQVKALTTTQMAALTTGTISALTTTQMAALTTTQMAALTTTQMAALTTAQLTALTTTAISTLASNQVQSLSPANIAGLTTSQVASLTNDQINALSTQVSNPPSKP